MRLLRGYPLIHHFSQGICNCQVCAFQFYLHMVEDQQAAWNDYLRLCKAGGSLGYFDLLKLANLENPFEFGTVEKATNAVVKRIDELEKML